MRHLSLEEELPEMRTLLAWRYLLLLPLLPTVALLALACGGGDEEGEEATATATEEGELFVDPDAPVVNVVLNEWSVEPEAATIEAGAVTFSAENAGTIPHELVIIKTDTPAGDLAVAGSKVDEDAAIGEIAEFGAGLTVAGTFDLAAGRYALVCNIAGHYEQGMFAEFTVGE